MAAGREGGGGGGGGRGVNNPSFHGRYRARPYRRTYAHSARARRVGKKEQRHIGASALRGDRRRRQCKKFIVAARRIRLVGLASRGHRLPDWSLSGQSDCVALRLQLPTQRSSAPRSANKRFASRILPLHMQVDPLHLRSFDVWLIKRHQSRLQVYPVRANGKFRHKKERYVFNFVIYEPFPRKELFNRSEKLGIKGHRFKFENCANAHHGWEPHSRTFTTSWRKKKGREPIMDSRHVWRAYGPPGYYYDDDDHAEDWLLVHVRCSALLSPISRAWIS